MIEPAPATIGMWPAEPTITPTVETEARFRLPNGAIEAKRLKACGGHLDETITIVDCWYAPVSVIDYDTHEEWLAGGGSPLRIREQLVGPVNRLSIEVKRPVEAQNYTHSVEAKLPLETLLQGEAFTTALGYHRIATLEKTRQLWTFDDVIVALDQYENGVELLELELVSPEGVSFAPTRLLELARELGAPASTAMDESAALMMIREQLRRRKRGQS